MPMYIQNSMKQCQLLLIVTYSTSFTVPLLITSYFCFINCNVFLLHTISFLKFFILFHSFPAFTFLSIDCYQNMFCTSYINKRSNYQKVYIRENIFYKITHLRTQIPLQRTGITAVSECRLCSGHLQPVVKYPSPPNQICTVCMLAHVHQLFPASWSLYSQSVPN